MGKKHRRVRARKKALIVVLGLCLIGGLAFWLWPSQQEEPQWETSTVTVTETTLTGLTLSEQTYTVDDLLDNVNNFVKTPKGGIEWKIFGETKQTPYKFKSKDGFDGEGFKPEFSPALKKLDGKEIIIQGYMFPLGQDEKQSEFLLGPFPVSCPFHYHVTANMIIEVHAQKPITFSYDPVNIKGTLELVPQDDEYNVFYRLKDAVKITEKQKTGANAESPEPIP